MVFLSLGGAYAARRSSARSPHQYTVAETMVVPGIKDFGKVNEYLYCGAQPKPQAIEELKKLGIDTIGHLRGERRGTQRAPQKLPTFALTGFAKAATRLPE